MNLTQIQSTDKPFSHLAREHRWLSQLDAVVRESAIATRHPGWTITAIAHVLERRLPPADALAALVHFASLIREGGDE